MGESFILSAGADIGKAIHICWGGFSFSPFGEAYPSGRRERGFHLCYTLKNMPNIEPILNFVFTDHALQEMARRQITQEDVRTVLAKPEQMEMVRDDRAVYQSRLEMGDPPKTYLVRVFVDIEPVPPFVVTVYRTSKIEKYWR